MCRLADGCFVPIIGELDCTELEHNEFVKSCRFNKEIPVKLRAIITVPAFVLVSLVSESAFAADCKSPTTQLELTQCASADLERETHKINNIYKVFRAKLNPQKQQQLKEVQLAWIKFRDLACKFNASGVGGGSAQSMVLSNCLTEETKLRSKAIESLANCQEGDLSCPAW